MTKCETDCREDLLVKVEDKIPKSTIWKAVLLFFMVWGIASGIYYSGLSERKEAIKKTNEMAIENKSTIAVIQNDLNHIRTVQSSMDRKLDRVLTEISKHESP